MPKPGDLVAVYCHYHQNRFSPYYYCYEFCAGGRGLTEGVFEGVCACCKHGTWLVEPEPKKEGGMGDGQ